MSRQLDNDGGSAEFFCRIPSLPDLDLTFSLERRQQRENAAIPDFNASVEPDTEMPMLFPDMSPNLPYLEGNRVETIRKPSESRGFSQNNVLTVSNPRGFEGNEATPSQLWDATRQREIIAKRPKAVYPGALSDAKVPSRRLSYHASPSRTSVEGTDDSSPCVVTAPIHHSPDGFQIENNLFIPIRDADSDLLATEQPLLPRTRLDSTATTPPPRLKLRPRGKHTTATSLALDICF